VSSFRIRISRARRRQRLPVRWRRRRAAAVGVDAVADRDALDGDAVGADELDDDDRAARDPCERVDGHQLLSSRQLVEQRCEDSSNTPRRSRSQAAGMCFFSKRIHHPHLALATGRRATDTPVTFAREDPELRGGSICRAPAGERRPTLPLRRCKWRASGPPVSRPTSNALRGGQGTVPGPAMRQRICSHISDSRQRIDDRTAESDAGAVRLALSLGFGRILVKWPSRSR
jgi:hypothetical protein